MVFSIVNRIIAKILKFVFELGIKFYISNDQYSEFVIILSVSLIITSILNFGMNNFIIKKFPRIDKYEKNKYLIQVLLINNLVFWIMLIFNILVFKTLSVYVIIISLLLSLTSILCAVLQSLFKVDMAIYFFEVQWYLFFFAIFFLYKFITPESINLNFVKKIYLISLIVNLIICVVYIRKKCEFRILNKFSTKNLKEIVEHSLPVLLTGVSYTILSRMDILMINNFLEKEYVGNYNVVARITSQLLFISQILLVVYLPKLSKNIHMNTKNKIKIQNKIVLSFSLICTIIPIYIFLILDTRYSIFSELGINRKMYFNVFVILSIEKIIYSCLILNSYIIYFYEKNKYIYINSILILVLNFILNYILIPSFGVLGATVATSIAIIVGHLVEFIQIYKIDKEILKMLIFKNLLIVLFLNIFSLLFLVKQSTYSINLFLLIINMCIFIYWSIGDKKNVENIFFNKE